MLNRVADAIYWMSRYVERAENTARLIDANLQLLLDSPSGQPHQWLPLVNATADEAGFSRLYGSPTQENVLDFLTFDSRNPNSILSCLKAARENARGTRNVISSAMWPQLNNFFLMVKSAAIAPMDLDTATEFFHQIKLSSHLFTGITDATMSRGAGWHFCLMGRMLERADKASRILDMKPGGPSVPPEDNEPLFDHVQWGTVLRSASAFEMYCKRYNRVSPRGVVEFLMLDREFPRSILFCLLSARDSLHVISGAPARVVRWAPEKLLGQLCADLEFVRVDDILRYGLHEYIDLFQTKLNQAGQAVGEKFFVSKSARDFPATKPNPVVNSLSNL